VGSAAIVIVSDVALLVVSDETVVFSEIREF